MGRAGGKRPLNGAGKAGHGGGVWMANGCFLLIVNARAQRIRSDRLANKPTLRRGTPAGDKVGSWPGGTQGPAEAGFKPGLPFLPWDSAPFPLS